AASTLAARCAGFNATPCTAQPNFALGGTVGRPTSRTENASERLMRPSSSNNEPRSTSQASRTSASTSAPAAPSIPPHRAPLAIHLPSAHQTACRERGGLRVAPLIRETRKRAHPGVIRFAINAPSIGQRQRQKQQVPDRWPGTRCSLYYRRARVD